MNPSRTTPALMVVAFLAMGGLLWWLSTTAPAEEVQVAEDGSAADTAEAEAGGGVTEVRMGDFANAREQYVGQRIRLRGVEVVGSVNDRLLWLAPEDNSVLLLLDSAMAAEAEDRYAGHLGTVTGDYRPMSDSVLNAWEDSGVIENENQRFSASFRSNYLEATQLDLRPGDDD